MTDPIADLEPEWDEAVTEAKRVDPLGGMSYAEHWLDHIRQVQAGEVPPDHRNPNYGGKQ